MSAALSEIRAMATAMQKRADESCDQIKLSRVVIINRGDLFVWCQKIIGLVEQAEKEEKKPA